MEYTGEPWFADMEAQWILDGPDSGGVRFFMLWRGHVFLVEQEFSGGTIGAGVPAAEFAARHRGADHPVYRRVVADLEARGLTA